MKQFAFLNSQGTVVYIVSPGNDDDYTDGQVYGEYTAREIAADEDGPTFVKTKYYKNGWQTKPEKPGEYYNWVLSSESWELDSARLFEGLRQLRTGKLVESDWTQIPDAPLTAEQKTAWQTYRQALRDIPANNADITDLDQVIWPSKPS